MDRTKVHLDTDFGGDIDDLCALALLLRLSDIEISGITTTLEKYGRRAGYVLRALALAGRTDVPVAAGADEDLGRFRLREYTIPPEERYWPDPVPLAPSPLDDALDLLRRSIQQGATVIGIGPFTNLSLLERRFPGMLRRADLCLMGGSIRPAPPGFPAWGHEMDFNVQTDVAAARHVLESADPDRVMLVPIEVTAQTALRRAYLLSLRKAGPLGRLVARQAEAFAKDQRNEEAYGRTCPGLPPDVINFQHDPLACAVALGWDGVTIETFSLALSDEGGSLRLRVHEDGRPIRVVTGVEQERFNSFWLDVVAGRHAENRLLG